MRRTKVEFAEPTQYMIDGEIFDATATLELETGPRVTMVSGCPRQWRLHGAEGK